MMYDVLRIMSYVGQWVTRIRYKVFKCAYTVVTYRLQWCYTSGDSFAAHPCPTPHYTSLDLCMIYMCVCGWWGGLEGERGSDCVTE